MSQPYPATELVLDSENRPYHIALRPEEVATKILLVGDQDRVDLIAEQFEVVEHHSRHREFVCKTGMYKGKRISAISTGIGTDNIDIVMNEIDALFNIDLNAKKDKSEITSLDIVRIGTCGILHAEIPVHSYILSTHAFGFDNVAHFYQIERTKEEEELCSALNEFLSIPEEIIPYLTSASSRLYSKLDSEKTESGITITSSGFYGPQGRQLRLKNRMQGVNEELSKFNHNTDRVANFEMESSALFAMGRALGHDCATICLGIANRPNMKFSSGYQKEMKELITYVLDRI